MYIHEKCLITLLASASLIGLAMPREAVAQPSADTEFSLASQPVDTALRQIARATGKEILFDPGDVRSLIAPALDGRMTALEAVSRIVAHNGLEIELVEDSIVIRKAGSVHGSAARQPAETIIVTGSRIAGAVPSGSLVTVTREQMRDAGQYQLGDVVRSIPQNFNGGQNPGVLSGSTNASDANVNSATAVNLRGLGADATLTLLNGKRLAYDSANEAIDISAIPLAAVSRIEVLTEGASAIYGSDAVAGVVNVLLKQDFDGVDATARLGGSTDGGNVDQQYSIVAGQSWSKGGFMLAGDIGRNSAIYAGQRSYTQDLNRSTTLLPAQEHQSLMLTGHHDVSSNVRFDIDALYNHRTSLFAIALYKDQDYRQSGFPTRSRLTSFVVSPRLEWTMAPNWALSLIGSYGEDKSYAVTDYNDAGALIYSSEVHYKNRIALGELGLGGQLLTLPGGDAKIAIGAGFRHNGLDSASRTVTATTTTAGTTFDETRKASYAFVEANLPLFSPHNGVSGIERLALTAALRHERYRSIGNVTTPKLGIVYAPLNGIAARASWGKSFKAPTFRQLYLVQRAALDLPSYYGATGYPAGSSVLQLSGGNPDLKPERAETWSAGLTLAPQFVPGLTIDLSYFHTNYKDRIVTPMASRTGALSNPAYSSIIETDPTVEQVEAAVASASTALTNSTGSPYDPSNVIAIIDNRSRNIARQEIEGVDTTLAYSITTASAGAIRLSGNISYLKSEQQLLPGQDPVTLAGTVFRPPNWRGRGGAVWQLASITLGGFVNYTGRLKDERYAAAQTLDSMTTFDANVRFEPRSATLPGFSIALSAMNIFNEKPERIRTAASYVPAFDSTNYSSIGRYVGLSLEKSW